MMNRIVTAMNLRLLFVLTLFWVSMGCLAAQEKADLSAQKSLSLGHSKKDVRRNAFLMKRHDAPVPPAHTHYTFATVLDGDTIPYIYLREVDVWGSYLLLTQKEIKKNGKLIRNVKTMLPYAREAKRRLDVLEVEIAQMAPKERKAALKKAEKDIEAEYKKDLKKRTYSQGLVLIKLIDRETSRSAYTLVKDLRGSFRAGLYQACAKLFGFNLKDKFDPSKNSKDDLIDRIVKSVDKGYL